MQDFIEGKLLEDQVKSIQEVAVCGAAEADGEQGRRGVALRPDDAQQGAVSPFLPGAGAHWRRHGAEKTFVVVDQGQDT